MAVTIEAGVALVTGAQRGLGAAFTRELLDRGVRKVYAASRHPQPVDDPRVVPVRLDVRSSASVTELADRARDVDLVVNNAGVYHYTPLLDSDLDAIRDEFETNVLGIVSVARAFAPILKANGGGAMLNVLALLSWLSAGDGYSATKAAAWSVTNGLRGALAPAGTLVTGLHVGYMDTRLTAGLEVPKSDPLEVARAALTAVAEGRDQVLADAASRDAQHLLGGDPAALVFNG